MRLSRTGWNNVIIFSVTIIIIFLNFTNDKLFHRNEAGKFTQDIPLFKEHAVILTLAINGKVLISRTGKSWKIVPESSQLKPQALEQMMLSWQNAVGYSETLKYDLSKQTPIVITAELVGEKSAFDLNLFPTKDQLLVFNKQTQQWLSLPITVFYQLIPREIFPHE